MYPISQLDPGSRPGWSVRPCVGRVSPLGRISPEDRLGRGRYAVDCVGHGSCKTRVDFSEEIAFILLY